MKKLTALLRSLTMLFAMVACGGNTANNTANNTADNTKNNVSDIEQLFRMMCFNVFAHNRDDHAKNFSYLYDETTHRFRLSPAYDLTYSTTYYGEHTTSINGNGANPTKNDLLQVGLKAGMNKNSCMQIIDEIEMIVKQELSKYL